MTDTDLRDFDGACGHRLPDYPSFTEQHAYCSDYCRRWLEPAWDRDEDEEGA